MRALSAPELLDVWERGWNQPPTQQALALLAAACPDTSPDTLAQLSVGQRDARLLTLRHWTFGPQLTGVAICPSCGERLEMTFNVFDIQASPLEEAGGEEAQELTLNVADYEVRFRLPNSLDLAAIVDDVNVAATGKLLLWRCLVKALHNGEEADANRLPSDVIAAVVERMAQADPQADVQLALSCPVCDHQWRAAFDIVSFFWSEINTWAQRILRQVHALARAYGWREADILTLSPQRRQIYLEMAGG